MVARNPLTPRAWSYRAPRDVQAAVDRLMGKVARKDRRGQRSTALNLLVRKGIAAFKTEGLL